MARITEYEAPEGLGIRPTETGVEATARAARQLGYAYSQAAQAKDIAAESRGSAIEAGLNVALKYAEHKEMADGSAAWASLVNAKTAEWDKINNDGDVHNGTAGKTFMAENLEPALSSFQQGFFTEKGQQWAQDHVDKLREHMQKKTTADMGRRAGNAIAADAVQTGNGLANTVRIDPSHDNVKLAIDGIDSGIGQVIKNHPGMDEGTRKSTHQTLTSKIKDDILDTAAVSQIYKTGQFPNWMDPSHPEYEPDWVKHIDSKKLLALQKQQEAVRKANDVEARTTENFNFQQQEREVKSLSSKNLAESSHVDPQTGESTLSPTYTSNALKILQDHPDSPEAAAQYEHAVAYNDSLLRKEQVIATKPAVLTDLNTRLFTTDNPTTELQILQAVNNKDLSHKDAQPLLALTRAIQEEPLKGPKFTAAMEAVKENVGVGLMPDGHARFSNFVNDFIPAYQKAIREGKSDVDLLNRQDPNSLISKIIGNYAPDPQARADAFMLKRMGVDPNLASTAQGADIARPKSQDEYDKLKSGTRYLRPDGSIAIKQQKPGDQL
jgi:hypothetical protein